MVLREQILADMKDAMRQKESLRLSALRMLQSAIRNKEIDKRGRGEGEQLTEDELVAVIRSEAKKRKDAIDGFLKGGKEDSANQERQELAILEEYLPAELDDAAIDAIVSDAIRLCGATSVREAFGRIMGEAMKKVAGRASGDRVRAALERAA